MDKPTKIEPGYGAVTLKDAAYDGINAGWTHTYVGQVKIHNRAALGIDDAKGSESWVAEIAAEDGGRRVFVPGCQVRAVEFGDYWRNVANTSVRHV